MNEHHRQLDSICKHFNLPKISEKFNNAYDYMDCYRTGLEKLSVVYNNITAQRIQIKYIEEKTEELEDLIDKFSVDIRDIKLNLNKAINEKKNCEELKEKSGIDKIEQDIFNMQNELNEIPNRINTAVENISACHIKNQHNEEELKNLNTQTEDAQKQAAYCETVFSEELNLGYNDIKADNILKAAASALKTKCDKSLSELRIKLSEKYYEEKNELIDYSVTETEYFTDEKPHKDTQRARTVLVARIGGKETDFYSLTEYLKKEIDKNESLITLKDKELFEELLIDTLGRKIRAKISGSERWVSEMNKKW